jgi:hypothetical protein
MSIPPSYPADDTVALPSLSASDWRDNASEEDSPLIAALDSANISKYSAIGCAMGDFTYTPDLAADYWARRQRIAVTNIVENVGAGYG